MHKLSTSRYVAAAISAVAIIAALACYHYYELHRQQIERDMQIQRAARLARERQDAIALVFSSELKRDAEEIAAPEIRGVCIGTNDGHMGQEPVDPSTQLIARLKASAQKIHPYSWCRELPRNWRVLTYAIEDATWESEEHATIDVARSVGINRWVSGREMYELSLLDGNWEIIKEWVGPPS